MTAEELKAWAVGRGWREIAGHLSLTKPGAKEPIVRLVLKATVANLEVRKPAGKWEKVAGAAYPAIVAGAEPEDFPAGLGFEKVPSLSMLMQQNRDDMVFSRFG